MENLDMHKNKKLATKKTTSLAKFDNWKDYYRRRTKE